MLYQSTIQNNELGAMLEQKEAVIEDLNRRLDETENRFQIATATLVQLENDKAASTEANHELVVMVESLRQDNETYKVTLSGLEKELSSITESHEKKSLQLQEITQVVENLEMERIELLPTFETLQSENCLLKESLETLKTQNESLAGQLSASTDESKRLSQELTDMSVEASSAKERTIEQQTRINELQTGLNEQELLQPLLY